MKENNNEIPFPGYETEIVREGCCEPKKCKSACCKIFMFKKNKAIEDYQKNFTFENKYGDLFFQKKCKWLDVKNNKCKAWGTKDFPEVCKQFPNIDDLVYRHVADVCSFKFVLKPKVENISIENVQKDKGKEV